MLPKLYHCIGCDELHESNIWYSRQGSPETTEYICALKMTRADLEGGWQPLPSSE